MCVNEQPAMGNKKPNQNWDDLRYFLAVARTGTLSAAAKQLGTEHTTVARHIQALEDELNSRLFHKSSSGYGLTDAGERLLAGAEAIESAYDFVKATVSSQGQPITGTVRIGDPMGLAASSWRRACERSLTGIPSSKSRSYQAQGCSAC
jgi:molybdate transport repressor ModE-like protein